MLSSIGLNFANFKCNSFQQNAGVQNSNLQVFLNSLTPLFKVIIAV